MRDPIHQSKNPKIQFMPDRFNPELVKNLAAAIAAKAGVKKADAAILADALVDADVHGTSTHGVSRLNIYIRRIQQRLINPKANLVIERRRGGTWVWSELPEA